MTKIVFPKNAQLCPHDNRHPTWSAADGDYGVCMMAPSHIENCIKLLITTVREIRASGWNNIFAEDVFPFHAMYLSSEAEDKLEMFLTERNRRITLGRWKVTSE